MTSGSTSVDVLKRIGWCVTGYIGAVFAATAATCVGLLILRNGPTDPLISIAALVFVFIFAGALIPALVFVTLAELMRIRHWAFFALAGLAAAIFGLFLFGFFSTIAQNNHILRITTTFSASGIVAGMVYWYIAGRHSGSNRQ